MRYTKWQVIFPSFSFMSVFGRGGNGNEVSAAGVSPTEVCAKSSPGATK